MSTRYDFCSGRQRAAADRKQLVPNTPVPIYKLVLYCTDPNWVPSEPGQVEARLRDEGLIGERFEFEAAAHYLCGERFLDAVMFLGCSPAVHLQPPIAFDGTNALDPSRFCNIRLRQHECVTMLAYGTHNLAPRCPNCRTNYDDWRALVTAWRDDSRSAAWNCPSCATAGAIEQLYWRHATAFGRFFVEIWAVHPHEAVPSERLLHALEACSPQPWDYCYTAS